MFVLKKCDICNSNQRNYFCAQKSSPASSKHAKGVPTSSWSIFVHHYRRRSFLHQNHFLFPPSKVRPVWSCHCRSGSKPWSTWAQILRWDHFQSGLVFLWLWFISDQGWVLLIYDLFWSLSWLLPSTCSCIWWQYARQCPLGEHGWSCPGRRLNSIMVILNVPIALSLNDKHIFTARPLVMQLFLGDVLEMLFKNLWVFSL